MKSAIAGVMPAESHEATVSTVWPSICDFPGGGILGRLFGIPWGIYIFRVGNLLALVTIPYSLILYFWRVLPGLGRRYRLTNRRVIVHKGLGNAEVRSLALGGFDSIEIAVSPGQAWFDAGDLVFRNQGTEVFRLTSVSRPEPFRQTCLKTRQVYVSVRELQTQRQAAS